MSGYDYGRIDPDACDQAIRGALDAGVNFFDVADVYGFGQAEEILGRALGADRTRVFVASKIGVRWDRSHSLTRDLSGPYVAQAVEASLRRLCIDSLSLCQIHWPDPRTPKEETAEALLACQRAGKIELFGICNCSLEEAKEWLSLLPIVAVQVPYNLLCRESENSLFSWCAGQRIGLLAHSGLARGFLSGKYGGSPTFERMDTRRTSRYFSAVGKSEKVRLLDAMAELAAVSGCSTSAIALRWILENPNVTAVLAGVKNVQQLEDNLLSVGWSLPRMQYDQLSELSEQCPGSMSGWFAGKVEAQDSLPSLVLENASRRGNEVL